MKIIVNSTSTYCHKTLPPLLASLSASGCPPENVIVVVNNVHSPLVYDTGSYSIKIVETQDNLLDVSGLNWVAEQRQNVDDFIFYLHDTTTVLTHFWNTIKDVKELKPVLGVNSIWMGVYPVPMIKIMKPFLSSVKNIKNMLQRNEYTSVSAESVFIGKSLKPFDESKIIAGMTDFYNTGRERQVEIYPHIGIVKYKGTYKPEHYKKVKGL